MKAWSMVRILMMAAIPLMAAGMAEAYNLEQQPFPVCQPPRFSLKPCALFSHRRPTDDSPVEIKLYASGKAGAPRVRLALGPARTGVVLSVVDEQGGAIWGPEFVTAPLAWGGIESTHSADLDRDGREDFIVYLWLGGCGLASGYYDLGFVLSSGPGYDVTFITSLWPGPKDFIDLKQDGSCQFIHTSYIHADKAEATDDDFYWVFNILQIAEGKLSLANDLHPGFPKWVAGTAIQSLGLRRTLNASEKRRLWREKGDLQLRQISNRRS